MPKSCFVIMPIGDQVYGDVSLSASDLRKRYDDLIREALLKADASLEVMRADDVAIPGTITSDILTRLMYADLVVADITYPNANVFYELGLRHASRTGTIIIRDRSGPHVPFDIAHLRHIEYENTPSGLKALAANFSIYIDHFNGNINALDNQFQEMAKLTTFQFPNYSKAEEEMSPEVAMMMACIQSPELIDLFSRPRDEIDQKQILEIMSKNPDIAGTVLKALAKSGQLKFGGSSSPPVLPQAAKRPPAPRDRKKPRR